MFNDYEDECTLRVMSMDGYIQSHLHTKIHPKYILPMIKLYPIAMRLI